MSHRAVDTVRLEDSTPGGGGTHEMLSRRCKGYCGGEADGYFVILVLLWQSY